MSFFKKNILMKIFLCAFTAGFYLFTDVSAFDGKIEVPHALKTGDTICVLELAGTSEHKADVFEKRLPEVVKTLENRGFKTKICKESFLATELGLGDGTEEIRAKCFNDAVNDPEIKAIFAFWGGYGAMQTLDKLDYKAFRKNRKIFVGFSDETAVELAIYQKAGVVTFHGPMVGASLNWKEEKCFNNLFDILMHPREETELRNIDDDSSFKKFKEAQCDCEAQVIGGNLCLIQNLIGTPYQPNFEGKILFFEEVGEPAYKIHRTLLHLKLTGQLDKLAGIMVGTITPVKDETEERLYKVWSDILKDLNIPIIYNVHAGHINNPLTLPIGSTIKIQGDKITIKGSVVC